VVCSGFEENPGTLTAQPVRGLASGVWGGACHAHCPWNQFDWLA